jgi:hypothetical protein
MILGMNQPINESDLEDVVEWKSWQNEKAENEQVYRLRIKNKRLSRI